MASINISIDLLGPVGSVPRPDRSDDSEQQRAAIERNIQATRRMVDAARDQPPHQITSLREQAQLDAGSMRAVDARGEQRAAAMDLTQGEAHPPIGASGAVVRPADIASGAGNAAAPGIAASSAGSPAPDLLAPKLVAPHSVAAGPLAPSYVASSSGGQGPAVQSPVAQAPVSTSLLAQSAFAPSPASPGAALTPGSDPSADTAADIDAVAGSSISPVIADALAEAQVARRAAAIAAAYRAFGEVDAAREIRARTRDLSPELAAEVMIAARATLEGIVSAFGKADGTGEPIGRVERLERWDGAPLAVRPDATTGEPRSTRYEHVATDLAAAMEHAGRGPLGELVTRDMATLILDTVGQGDEYRLSAFALGVPFGTGLTLPLALAEELERRGDRRRQQLLFLAMEQGLKRLKQRIATTVRALIELTLPLADLLAIGTSVDANDRDRLLQLLRSYADREAHFLSELEDLLRRVDAVGSDAFFVLDALRRRSHTTAALLAARNELLASPATAFAIAQSASAQEAALHRGETNRQPAPRSVIQGLQHLYAELGFSSSRSSLLARATFAHGELPMEARWAVLNSADNLDRQSRLFEALLRFFGAAATPKQIRSVELSDAEDEVIDRPVWGLELYRSLEQ